MCSNMSFIKLLCITVSLLVIFPFIVNQHHFNKMFHNFHHIRRNHHSRSTDSDAIIFEDNDYPRTNNQRNGFNWNKISRDNSMPPSSARPPITTPAVPGMETTRSPCEQRCLVTSQYNPVCGSNDMTYSNPAMLKCAQRCGKRISLLYYGVCTSSVILFKG